MLRIILLESTYSSRTKVISAPVPFTNRISRPFTCRRQRVTLYTAVGQPFTAKMAVVNLDTPYFKGHATVGLVANLAADALLGMDKDLAPIHLSTDIY
jgi:hypothetical protein